MFSIYRWAWLSLDVFSTSLSNPKVNNAVFALMHLSSHLEDHWEEKKLFSCISNYFTSSHHHASQNALLFPQNIESPSCQTRSRCRNREQTRKKHFLHHTESLNLVREGHESVFHSNLVSIPPQSAAHPTICISQPAVFSFVPSVPVRDYWHNPKTFITHRTPASQPANKEIAHSVIHWTQPVCMACAAGTQLLLQPLYRTREIQVPAEAYSRLLSHWKKKMLLPTAPLLKRQ